MSNLNLFSEKKFWPMPRCVTRELQGKRGVLQVLRIDSNVQVFTIVGVAATVWKRIDGKTPMAKVIHEVTQKFEVTEARASKDIQKFIAGLLKLRLIREGESDQLPASKLPYSSSTKSLQLAQKPAISGKVRKKSVARRRSCSAKNK